MISMPVPDTGLEPQDVHDALLGRYKIEIPVLKWQDHTIVRLSVQGYNSRLQMDSFINALTEIFGLAQTTSVPRRKSL